MFLLYLNENKQKKHPHTVNMVLFFSVPSGILFETNCDTMYNKIS